MLRQGDDEQAIKGQYPTLDEKQRQEAAYYLDAYIKLVIEIFESKNR